MYHLSVYTHAWKTGPCLNIKKVIPGVGISIIKIRRLSDRLIFIMIVSILVRQHLYIETTPRFLFGCVENMQQMYLFSFLVWYFQLVVAIFVGNVEVPCDHDDHYFVFNPRIHDLISHFRWVCYWTPRHGKYFFNLSWQPICDKAT